MEKEIDSVSDEFLPFLIKISYSFILTKEILKKKKKKNSVYIILVSIRNMNNNKKKVIFHLPIYVL